MIGSLIKAGGKLGVVTGKLHYGWVVTWTGGKKEIISWNTKERKWKARDKPIKILSEGENKNSERKE